MKVKRKFADSKTQAIKHEQTVHMNEQTVISNPIKMTKATLKKLRSQLPPNYMVGLRSQFKISEVMIRAILRGDYTDRHGVIHAAIKIAEDHKAATAELSKKILTLK